MLTIICSIAISLLPGESGEINKSLFHENNLISLNLRRSCNLHSIQRGAKKFLLGLSVVGCQGCGIESRFLSTSGYFFLSLIAAINCRFLIKKFVLNKKPFCSSFIVCREFVREVTFSLSGFCRERFALLGFTRIKYNEIFYV